MPWWKKNIVQGLGMAVRAVEQPYDYLKHSLKRRFRRYGEVTILPYRGYGNRHRLYMMGRVLEARELAEVRADDSWWRNAKAMARRFKTDEIPGARIRATYHGTTLSLETDDEGYFTLDMLPAHEPSPENLWHDVSLELVEAWSRKEPPPTITGQVLVPPEDAEFGVISDIDDTVMRSNAFDTWRLVRLSLLKNSRTRATFEGAAAFYRALQGGSDGERKNPFFYVSSSAWNIYDVLDDFLEHQGFPAGPVLLRDLGISKGKFITGGHGHKLEKIERILEMCGSVRFILIGDSGQRDPFLYREIVLKHPGRIIAVYIRDVLEKHSEEVKEIARAVTDAGVPMLLMPHSEDAAKHAVEQGWIPEPALAGVARQRREEESLPQA